MALNSQKYLPYKVCLVCKVCLTCGLPPLIGANVPVVLVHSVSGLSVITPGGPLQFYSPLGSLCGSNRWPAVRCCVLTPQGS